MRQARWDYTCDWCGTEETRQTETLPEGWKLSLIGTDNRGPSKWEKRRHVCEQCYGSPIPLNPAYTCASDIIHSRELADADKD